MSAHNFKDLTGMKFQHLTVKSRYDDLVYKDGKIKVRWLCKCDCGNEVVKYARDLKMEDRVVSCGCMTPKRESKYVLVGKSVGFLTVLEQTDQTNRHRERLWLCRCECGTELLVATATLAKEEKKSCGCKTKSETAGTHGMYGTPTYKSWSSMRDRCNLKSHKSYDYYKHVSIDERWQNSFEEFFSDMGERPEGMTLDRIDTNKGYCKENCRWADASVQQQNKRPNYINKHNGLAGVGACGKNKFAARIRHNGKREYIGTFDTPEEANDAYNRRGEEIFGDLWVYKGTNPDEE